jgi:hypothetical protein
VFLIVNVRSFVCPTCTLPNASCKGVSSQAGGSSVPVPLQPTEPQAVPPRLTVQDCDPTLVGENRTVTVFSWFAARE